MRRRDFLNTAAGLALARPATAAPPMIVDTHTHFYDPARAQGVPWPAKADTTLYRTVLPKDFVAITKPLGVTGTIIVEASAWLEDNQWILDMAANEPAIFGFVGHLEAGRPEFRSNLARFHKNRLFLGIRLSSSSLSQIPANAQLVSDLKALAAQGLELDAIGGPSVLTQVARLTDRVPELRVVIDHLPFDAPTDSALRELAKRERVYAKVSNVPRSAGGRVPEDVSSYRPALDELWEIFGPDRLVYASNWPVSDKVAPYATALKIVTEYFAGKGPEAAEKFFWKNSKAAYRWDGKKLFP